MDLRLFYALILTLIPLGELRIGLPLAIFYALDNKIPVLLIFLLIFLVNILLIFLAFWFFDNLHHVLLKLKFYRKFFEMYLKRFQKRVDKFEKRHSALGFSALILLVAFPVPGTGVWSGCLLSWLLDLDRKKSMLSIALGVLLAGLFVFIGTLGFASLL